MSSKTHLVPKKSELRIVLFGMVQVGKTQVKNAILGCSEDHPKPVFSSSPGTGKYQKEEVKIEGRNVVVVNTPGLRDAEKEDEDVVKEIKACVSLVRPGPHVFLFVLRVQAFTSDGKQAVEIFKKTFGKDVLKYTIVVFTNGEELKENGRTIHEFINDNDDLKSFVSQCKDRCHVIENTDQSSTQVTELLQQINTVVEENKGKHYEISQNRKKLALAVNGSAVVGAGVGGTAVHFIGSAFGIPVGAVVGAAVGGVLGCVGIVMLEQIKARLLCGGVGQGGRGGAA